MIRSFIIVVNLFIALIIRMISEGPTADVNAPSSVKAGESFVVEVTVHTNGEKDFMRYSMELPNGWTAEPVEMDGGTFKFDKQNVKVLWSSVAGKADLKISYKVSVPSDAKGDVYLNCKISHPVNNLPANIELTPLKISVIGSSSSTNSAPVVTVDSTAKPPAEISIERDVPTEPVSGSFIVNIVIHKEDLTSFGKIEDTLPSGFTAKLIKADGADFKFENGVARFGWFGGMPKKSTLNVQYKVIISPDVNGDQTIGGHFSYVENEKGKVIPVASSTVKIKEKDVVASNTTTNNSGNNSTSTTTTDNSGTKTADNSTAKSSDNSSTQNTSTTNSTDNSTTQTADNSTAKSTDNSTTQTTDNSTAKSTDNQGTQTANNSGTTTQQTTTTNPDTAATGNTTNKAIAKGAAVKFSVQIAAMVRDVPVSYFKNTFNIAGTIDKEAGSLFKYLTGSFGSYQEAHDHRDQVRGKGVSDAFVVAYNGLQRITVQEALMITSQKWIL